MNIIYLARDFQPVPVYAVTPGDIHDDPGKGECRRLTAKRFCLVAERLGTGSAAFQAVLDALERVADNGCYDGRALEDWYGLIGMPRRRIRDIEDFQFAVCSRCGQPHWYGVPELRDLCFDCWFGAAFSPTQSSEQKDTCPL